MRKLIPNGRPAHTATKLSSTSKTDALYFEPMSKCKPKPQLCPSEPSAPIAAVSPVFFGEPPTIDPETGYHVEKVEDWQREPAELPWQIFNCRNCNGLVTSRIPAKHDICELCGYLIRTELAEMEVKAMRRRADVYINPFAGPEIAPPQAPLPPIFGRRSVI
jgi:hypothetical protein